MKKVILMLAVIIAIFSGALKGFGFLYSLGLEDYPSISVETSDSGVKIDWKYASEDNRNLIITPHSLEALSRFKQESNKYLAVVLNDIHSKQERTVTYFSALTTINNQGKKTTVWETGHDRTGGVVAITMLSLITLSATLIAIACVKNSG
jgi:hypothetical protein